MYEKNVLFSAGRERLCLQDKMNCCFPPSISDTCVRVYVCVISASCSIPNQVETRFEKDCGKSLAGKAVFSEDTNLTEQVNLVSKIPNRLEEVWKEAAESNCCCCCLCVRYLYRTTPQWWSKDPCFNQSSYAKHSHSSLKSNEESMLSVLSRTHKRSYMTEIFMCILEKRRKGSEFQ